MPISLTKDELLSITQGSSVAQSNEKIVFSAVEYDSREIKGGELFIALGGEKTHGHAFLKTAYDRGASMFLVESEEAARGLPDPSRAVVVADTLKAFHGLAHWWRKKLNTPILAITGSVGKTTTKELAAAVLLQVSVGSYSKKSFNNHVGVPYSICKIGPEHQWAVLEMGMNHRWELSTLTRIAEPDAAIITCIGPAHIENLGSLEEIGRAKFEIAEGIREGGTLILNGDDPILKKILPEVEKTLSERRISVLYFGKESSFPAQVTNVVSKGFAGVTFDLRIHQESRSVKLSVLGAHNAMNAGSAVLGAHTIARLSLDQAVKALHAFTAPYQRMQIHELGDGKVLIDDSYNANPESMRALFEMAIELRAKDRPERLGLILGDMLELGPTAPVLHEETGRQAARLMPDFVITVGKESTHYHKPCAERGAYVAHAESPELAAKLALSRGFDLLLVKGSRGIQLERAVQTITKELGSH